MLLLAFVGLAMDARAECASGVRTSDVESRLVDAEAAYSDLDEAKFQRLVDETGLLLPCLGDPIDRATAARYHRLEGLRLFATGDEPHAMAAMQASRVVVPEYVFPDPMLDPANGLRQQYEALPTTEGAVRHLARPRVGSLRFDGTESRDRPLDRTAIVQLLDDGGQVTRTAVLTPEDAMVDYPAVPRRRHRLLVLSTGSLVLSGLAYGTAWSANLAAHDPDNPHIQSTDDLDRYQSRTRMWTGVSVVFLAGGAGVGLSALAVDR